MKKRSINRNSKAKCKRKNRIIRISIAVVLAVILITAMALFIIIRSIKTNVQETVQTLEDVSFFADGESTSASGMVVEDTHYMEPESVEPEEDVQEDNPEEDIDMAERSKDASCDDVQENSNAAQYYDDGLIAELETMQHDAYVKHELEQYGAEGGLILIGESSRIYVQDGVTYRETDKTYRDIAWNISTVTETEVISAENIGDNVPDSEESTDPINAEGQENADVMEDSPSFDESDEMTDDDGYETKIVVNGEEIPIIW